MSNNKGDLAFTFDASGFESTVKKMAGSLKTLETNTAGMVGKVGKGVAAGMAKVGIIFEAIKGLAGGLGSVIKEFVPELGAVFGMAKNIIFKNLLFPLRQALLPILQKIMNWVRDNRKLFVELGGVLVNAFKMVKSVLMSVFNMVKPIIDMIKKAVGSIFGDTAKSAADTLNMLMLKIMVFSMMVSNGLKPIFEGLGKVIEAAFKLIKGAVDEFLKSGGLTAVRDLFQSIGDIMSEIFGDTNNMNAAMAILKGTVDLLVVALKDLSIVLDAINKAMTGNDVAAVKKLDAAIKSYKPGQENEHPQFTPMPGPKFDMLPKQNDAVMQNGKLIPISSQDTVIATKHPGGGGGVTVNVGGINVTATEGNAVSVGENIIKGMERQIKNVLLNSLTLEGI